MPGMDGLTAARAIRDRAPDASDHPLHRVPRPRTRGRKHATIGVAMSVGKVEGLNQLERHITELCRDLRAG